MDQSFGQKIEKKMPGPQFGPDKKCKEEGTLKEGKWAGLLLIKMV